MEKEDDYVEYVPVAKRRAMEAHKILQRKIMSFGLEEKSDKLKLTAQANPSLLVKAQSEKSNFVAEDKPSRPSLLVKSLEMKHEAPKITPNPTDGATGERDY
ncbi:DEAD-box ATP-dependent RNA helicase 35-like [Prunus yedoensis var. nudiflora]|uniref:DEAD-box ATP-dependent RNA helicase 35-like n=1 Tax=Prunus yedoensis var. nudiflora TaxID=2094558 RepID=A0A314Y751_PRUYE|nr:DEAD-box ATP-dependent RNA helicase 35-like [Prunus yedoensis var. nudiflora]